MQNFYMFMWVHSNFIMTFFIILSIGCMLSIGLNNEGLKDKKKHKNQFWSLIPLTLLFVSTFIIIIAPSHININKFSVKQVRIYKKFEVDNDYSYRLYDKHNNHFDLSISNYAKTVSMTDGKPKIKIIYHKPTANATSLQKQYLISSRSNKIIEYVNSKD